MFVLDEIFEWFIGGTHRQKLLIHHVSYSISNEASISRNVGVTIFVPSSTKWLPSTGDFVKF